MPARFLFLHVPLRISPRMSKPPSDSTLQFRLWGGFGEALRRLGEAFGASELILGGFGRLWRGFGSHWGGFGEDLGSFGQAVGVSGDALKRLWGGTEDAFGNFGVLREPFFSSRLLFLPYILKINKLPINRFSGPILIWGR